MTRAPRSWPSSPGLATRTRVRAAGEAAGRSPRELVDPSTRRLISEPRGGLIGPELLFQHVRDLAQRAVSGGGLADVRLQVVGPSGGLGQPAQRALGLSGVALALDAADPLRGLARSLGRAFRELEVRLAVRLADGGELVDPDHGNLALLHRPLVLVGALRDALLDESLAQAFDHPAAR